MQETLDFLFWTESTAASDSVPTLLVYLSRQHARLAIVAIRGEALGTRHVAAKERTARASRFEGQDVKVMRREKQ